MKRRTAFAAPAVMLPALWWVLLAIMSLTLVVFAVFSVLYLKEPLAWNHAVGFALIAAGAFFVFQKW